LSLRDLAHKKNIKIKKRKGRTLTSKESQKIRRQGYQAERQLVNILRSNGFNAVRIPVSAPSSEPLPDVLATKEDQLFAFEVKNSKADKIYFRKNQIQKLFKFLEIFMVYKEKSAIIAGKFPYKWVFKKVTSTEDYIMKKSDESNIKLMK
jgi:Holliday junction resolvase